MIALKAVLTEIKNLQQEVARNITVICCITFIVGSSLAIHFFHEDQVIHFSQLVFGSISLAAAAILIYLNRENFFFYIAQITTFFLLGGLFALFYLINHNNYQKITGNLFGTVTGRVMDYQKGYNAKSGKPYYNVTMDQLQIEKRPFVQKKNIKKKRFRRVTPNYILKNYQNLKSHANIDEHFLEDKKNYIDPIWVENSGKLIYSDPPKAIKLFIRDGGDDFEIGDVIKLDAMITTHQKKGFIKGFDYEFYLNAKSIANSGYALSAPKILEKRENDNVRIFFGNLRKEISQIIHESSVTKENAGVIDALLTGNKRGIEKKYYQVIKDSGLAHLISISGLHLSLAAGIFFVIFRFILTRLEFVALNFDVKKISALLSILSSYIYLNIADMPISAIRAFIGISFFMIAILLDRRLSPIRMTLLAAVIIVVINPFYVFFVAFQLSFSSILAIVFVRSAFNNFIKEKFSGTQINAKRGAKILKNIAQTVSMSFAAQIATTPFLIYHFGNFPIYSILSNIIAIPLASFVTMPLGFFSFFLMPFNLQDLVLIPMSYSVDAIFQVASYVASIKASSIKINSLSDFNFVIIVISFLTFIIFSSKFLRMFSILAVLAMFVSGKKDQNPNILIDGGGSYFALFDQENGLIFSKKVKKSWKVRNLMEKIGESELKYFSAKNIGIHEALKFPDSMNCGKKMCEIDLGRYFSNAAPGLEGKKMLVLYKRVELAKICQKGVYDVVINLTKKYRLPKCILQEGGRVDRLNGVGGVDGVRSSIVIDNGDLLKKGSHFIFFDEDGAGNVKSIVG